MRKPVFPRIIIFLLVYIAVFTVLVTIQFAKRGGFTQRVGSLMVSGHYRLPGENEAPVEADEYLLDGDVHVFFGGIDFSLVKGDDRSLILTTEDGENEEILPERMIIQGDSVRFVFPGGTEMQFATQYSGGSLEMRISAFLSEGIEGMELPFKPMRRTEINDLGDGQFIVRADGERYSFGRSLMDAERMVLLISSDGNAVSYRHIQDRKTFTPDDFILAQARTAEAYNEALTRWRDQNFSLWNRTISDQNNEDIAMAFAGEALVRGTYKAAVAAVPPVFLRGNARTYESSVYFGSLEQHYRSLVTREREKITRISRQINEKSLEFLMEMRVFGSLAVRGQFNFVDAGAELIRTIDPAILAMDIIPGILEGYMDWKIIRPARDNPFEGLVDQACFVVLDNLRITDERVFAFIGNRGETEYNLRLGMALLAYAGSVQNSTWEGIGRSLILSALSMGDLTGMVRDALVFSDETGEISESSGRLTSARLHRILNPVEIYPRAVSFGAPASGLWAWTTAQAVSSTQQNDILDIAVRFPMGETHYMIIRGIRPFARIQLYGRDFRSDPQFERYDSSGWVYHSQDQLLLLKMRHQETNEQVRIIFREEAPPVVEGEAAPEAELPPSAPAVIGSGFNGF